jgi:hypothetical protein
VQKGARTHIYSMCVCGRVTLQINVLSYRVLTADLYCTVYRLNHDGAEDLAAVLLDESILMCRNVFLRITRVLGQALHASAPLAAGYAWYLLFTRRLVCSSLHIYINA